MQSQTNTSHTKIAIVTGGSRGIGKAIALQLAQQGNAVVVNYQSNRLAAESVVNEILTSGGQAVAIQADVAKPDSIRHLFSETQRLLGQPSILVINAAIQVHKPLLEHQQSDIDSVIDINAKGAFMLIQEAAKHLSDEGHIVALSTSLTSMMVPGYAAYQGDKAAVEQFVRSSAKELAKRGININSIAPGPVNTELLRNTESEQGLQFLAGLSGFGRLGSPEDIAGVVGFFCSSPSRWVSGQIIRANGALI